MLPACADALRLSPTQDLYRLGKLDDRQRAGLGLVSELLNGSVRLALGAARGPFSAKLQLSCMKDGTCLRPIGKRNLQKPWSRISRPKNSLVCRPWNG